MPSASAAWRGPVADGTGLRLDLQRAAAEGYRRHSAWRRDSGQLQLRGETPQGGEWTLLGNHLDLAADDPQGLTAAQLADRRASSQGAQLFDTRKTVSQQQLGARFAQPVVELAAETRLELAQWHVGSAAEQLVELLFQDLRVEQLLAILPFVQRLALIEAFVALHADQRQIHPLGKRGRKVGLADTGRAFDQDRLAQAMREENRRGNLRDRNIADRIQPGGDCLDRGHRLVAGFLVFSHETRGRAHPAERQGVTRR
mgnify:CR=1 FL=1